MGSKGPAQAFETPFNMSDYVQFDFDFEAPHQTVDSISRTSVAEPLQGMSIHDPYTGFVDSFDAVDADFAGIFQLPNGSIALGDGFNAIQAASEDLSMTDDILTVIETGSSLDDFSVFEPSVFAHGTDQAALEVPPSPSSRVPLISETHREPSRWVPASPELQQHLSTVYASQLSRISADPNATPVLYLAAEHESGSPASSISSLPNSVTTQYELPQTSRTKGEVPSIDPSLLTNGSPGLHRQELSSSGMFNPISLFTDSDAPNVEGIAMSRIKKRPLDANEPNSEPAPKRSKLAQAEPLPTVAKDDNSDDDDEPAMQRTKTALQIPLPMVAKDNKSHDEFENDSENKSEDGLDDKSYDSKSSDSSSASPYSILPPSPVARKGPSTLPPRNPTARKAPNWRYEQAEEVRLRNQRRKEWDRRRVNPPTSEGKALDRKMQKLLEEIEDTEGFAEAQGYKIGESVGKDSVRRRPVRKGARKNYVGQE